VEDFVKKGGTVADAEGRKCLCNGLVANIGLSQNLSADKFELPLLTAGDQVADVAQFLKPGCDSYTAAEVISRLLDETVPVNGKVHAAAHPDPVTAG
jgi:hypothetical protein